VNQINFIIKCYPIITLDTSKYENNLFESPQSRDLEYPSYINKNKEYTTTLVQMNMVEMFIVKYNRIY